MQGQKSAIGSLPDSINFDYGSTSSSMGIDQQICWNTLHDPAESTVISQEAHNWSRWNIGEPSSSNHHNLVNHNETMAQNGLSSSMRASAGAGQVNNSASIFSRNGVNLDLNSNASFFWTSNSGSTSHSHDISLGQLGQVGDLMEYSQSHPSKSSELEHRLFPSSSGASEPFASSSGSGGFLPEEDDNRPGYALDGRRLSCKRKTSEGSAGQQPSSSVTYFSREGSSSSLVSSQLDTSLGVSAPNREHPRLRLSMGGVVPSDCVNPPTIGIDSGSSHRNYRVRTNPTTMPDSLSNNLVFPRVSVGHSDAPAGHHQSLRFVPVNPSRGLTPPLIHPENAISAAGSRRNNNMQRVRWSAGSSSRAGSSAVEMDPPLHDLNSRPPPLPMPRNISEHPMFTMPSPHNNAAGLNLSGGSVATSRHVGSSSSSRSSAGPAWGPQRHSSSQYSRRLSEYVRRSLLSSVGSSEGGGSTSALRSASASQEVVLPVPSAVGGAQGHNPPFSRSAALWMDRRGGDGAAGVPYALRALAAAGGGEGRSRLVSEHIRNVLDIMRRGEGLRFEDVMILDPSVLFGMADIHDQHRDMRLDIDNMSYEELLALEERIGYVSTGLTEEKILARLKRRKYLSVRRVDQTETEPCCVCQEEYKNGEDLGVLDCGHEFHAACIKQWLGQKNSCPICKTTGLAT